MRVSKLSINLLSANPTKQSNTFKQFYQQHLTNCFSVFEHFAGLVLKALIFDFFKMQILNALFFSEMLLFDKSFRQRIFRSNHPEVFLGKGVLEICSKFTGEHPCRNVFSNNVIEITLRHGFSSVNLLHIFRTAFLKNTSGWLLLDISKELIFHQ